MTRRPTRATRVRSSAASDEDKRQKENNLGFSVTGKSKSIFSIRNKMINKGVNFDNIFDKFAVRIIVDSSIEAEKADCWKIYSIVTDFYKPNPDRLRDWVSTPKVNGYESLHTTVIGENGKWVEVPERRRGACATVQSAVRGRVQWHVRGTSTTLSEPPEVRAVGKHRERRDLSLG